MIRRCLRCVVLCRRVLGTNLRNVPENVSGHKSLRLSTTWEIRTINGVQTLMDLQHASQQILSRPQAQK